VRKALNLPFDGITYSTRPEEEILRDTKTQQLHAKGILLLGKLDGITQLLPDLGFFILMYIRKEAARSSEIDGTKATIIDVIKSEIDIVHRFPDDIDRILHYIQAMEYGLHRLETLPLSLRFIREIHKVLLEETTDEPGKTPENFENLNTGSVEVLQQLLVLRHHRRTIVF
jgi:Fic family protein